MISAKVKICTADKILHNTPIASVCTRNHDKDLLKTNDLARISLANKCSYDSNALFIPVTKLFSTVMLVSGLDAARTPINTNQKRMTEVAEKKCSKLPKESVDHLVLLELHPERYKLCFDIDCFKSGYYNDSNNDEQN